MNFSKIVKVILLYERVKYKRKCNKYHTLVCTRFWGVGCSVVVGEAVEADRCSVLVFLVCSRSSAIQKLCSWLEMNYI